MSVACMLRNRLEPASDLVIDLGLNDIDPPPTTSRSTFPDLPHKRIANRRDFAYNHVNFVRV